MIKKLISGEIGQKEALIELNAHIWYKPLPKHIRGFVFSKNELNCIVVNNYMSDYLKKKTILHEIAHIELNHLNQINKDMFAFYIENREDEADRYIKFIKDNIN